MRPTVPEPVPLPPVLSRFGDSLNELLDLLRRRVDDEMLRLIARADHPYDVDLNFQILCEIRDSGIVPAPLDFNPREVCQLLHWADLNELGRWGIDGGERGHVERAFVCAVLLRSGADVEMVGKVLQENSALAQLLDSVSVLDGSLPGAALKLVLWRLIFAHDLGEDRPYFVFAAALLSLLVFGSEEHGPGLVGVLDWLAEEVSRRTAYEEAWDEFFRQGGLGTRRQGRAYADRWLLSVTTYDQRHEVWERLARQLLLERELPYSPAVNERLRHVGRLVTGEE